MELHSIEIEVLARIRPNELEYKLVLGAFEKIANTIRQVLRENNVEAEVSLQGSVAHDTWLSGDRDIDVFVLFPDTWEKKDLVSRALPLLVEAARRLGDYELMFAEHPYVRLKYSEVEADIVPGIKLKHAGQIKTAVDRTPFHTEYINSVLTREQRDHVRLLKKFMKSIGVYGAEVKTKGFSGYATELLIATYGSFRRTLEEATKWKPPVFVDTLRGALTPQLKKTLEKKYPDSCIYMPDPVDPERNVTANVSLKSLALFILASKCYTAKPSVDFFEEPQEPGAGELLNYLKNRCVVFLVYNLRERLPPDVIWGEAQRVATRLSRIVETLGVKVVDYSAWTNDADLAVIAAEFEQCVLPAFKHYRGPCIVHEDARIQSFIEKHIGRGYGPWVSPDGCLESLDTRDVERAEAIIESRWHEFTVAPHFRNVKPVVHHPTLEFIKWVIEMGGGRWLRDFSLKTPHWMVKCIS